MLLPNDLVNIIDSYTPDAIIRLIELHNSGDIYINDGMAPTCGSHDYYGNAYSFIKNIFVYFGYFLFFSNFRILLSFKILINFPG